MQRHSIVYGFTPGRIDVFWCAPNETSLMHTWSDGTAWNTETIAEGNHPFAPAAAIYPDQPGKMDVGWVERWGKIKYRQFNGGRWLPAVELNPSGMAAASGSPPSNFHLNSPLAGCPNPINRRSGSTEFFVKDVGAHLWNLSSDGTTWTVADCHIDGVAFDPVQVREKINTPSPSPHLFWCDEGTFAMHVSSAGAVPDSVTTLDVPNASRVAVQPVAHEGFLPQRLDIFWADETDLFNTSWDDTKDPSEGESKWAENNALRNFGTWTLDGNNLHIYLNGHTRDGVVNGDVIDGTGIVQGRRFNWRATRVTAAGGAGGSLDNTEWECTDADDNKVLTFVLSATNVERTAGTLAASDSGNHPPQHYSSYAPVSPVYGFKPERVDLFWRSEKGELIDTYSDGKLWRSETIATDLPFFALPAAVNDPARSKARVFWVDPEGGLWSTSSDGGAWETEAVYRAMPGPVAISGFKPGRMDVFWGGIDRQLKQAAGDGTTWDSVRLNPGRMSSPAAVSARFWFAQQDPLPLELFWGDESGSLLYEWFDGNWHIRQLADPGNMKSPPACCTRPAEGGGTAKFVYWVNNLNQLCETCLWPGLDWRTTIIDFTSAIYRSAEASVPAVSPPTFSSRFAPVLAQDNNYWILVCDAELKLWSVRYQPADVPTYRGQDLQLGPLAHAPTAAYAPVYKGDPTGGGAYTLGLFVYWCAQEDMSLRQSWPDADWNNWQTITVDPGPFTSAPAVLQSGPTPTHIFWRARDGSLKHTWALTNSMGVVGTFLTGETYHPVGWQTETIDPGPVSSDPYAVYNQERIYVFWLDSSGKLQQTSQNAPAGQAGWGTINIAPATNDGSNWRDL